MRHSLKSIIALLLCVVLLSTTVLTSCGGGDSGGGENQGTSQSTPPLNEGKGDNSENVDSCSHTGGTATCKSKAVCSKCGISYGSIDPDNHTGSQEWTKTETKHAALYNCCGKVVIAEENHKWNNGICSVCGKEDVVISPSDPTDILTEAEWRDCFNSFSDQRANYTVLRYSATENTRHNATFFVDGEKYHKHTFSADTYCIKTSDTSYIKIYKDMTGTSYSAISNFSYDGDGEFLTYSELAEYYSDFEYDPINGVYAYHVEDEGDIFIFDVKIKDKKVHSMVLIADGMHLIYEFSNYGITTVDLPNLEADGNYIYEKNEDSTWKIAKCIAAESNVVIPSTYKGTAVTVIGENAFYSNSSIRSVMIPSSIKTIEDYAFSSSSVTTVDIAEGVTYIGNGAFRYSQLETISLPNSLEHVGKEAFLSNSTLVFNVKDNINYLGNSTNPYLYAYGIVDYWDYSITSVTLDTNCKFIADYALATDYLKEINVEEGNQYFSSHKGILLNKNQTEVISAPRAATGEFIVPSSVKKINENAFGGSLFSRVVLPDDLEIIEARAFQWSNITSITIGNSVTRIEEYTFEDCGQLVSVTIGDKVSVIEDYAFSGCASLYNVTFSSQGNLKSIGIRAFEECTSLESLILPEGLESLGMQFVANSNNLKYLSVPNSLLHVDDGAFHYLPSLEYNLKDYVAYIGNSENPYLIADYWTGDGKQSQVVIQDSCKFIMGIAFEYDGNIESVVLGENLVSIGESAFYGCYGLKVIYNLSYLSLELGSDQFGGIAKYASVIYTTLNTDSILKQTNDGFKYYVQDDICYIYAYVGEANNITIPTSIDSKNCKIVAGAFQGNSTIVSVSIPFGVELSNGIFLNCTNLKSVTIADGVLVIPASMFYGCSSLTNITLPQSITSIEKNAFCNCTSLTKITIPQNVTTIAEEAFYGCTDLLLVTNDSKLVLSAGDDSHGYVAYYAKEIVTSNTQPSKIYRDSLGLLYYLENDQYVLYAYEGTEENLVLPQTANGKSYTIADEAFANNCIIKNVVLPNGLKIIPKRLFSGCANLEQVILPGALEIIDEYAFYGCTSLKSIQIPTTVKSIGDAAFNQCSSLKNVTFDGNSIVQSLGEYAFYECSALEAIILPDSITEIGWNCFQNCTSLAQVTLPSSIEILGWSTFNQCCSLKEIVIPDSVKELDHGVFMRCHNLRKITIGRGVEKFGDHCFTDCFRLTEVINLSSTTFPGVIHDLTNTYYGHGFEYSTDDGQNRFITTDEGFIFYKKSVENGIKYYLIGYEGNETEITLPANIDGNAYIIHSLAFAECEYYDCCGGITSVIIPDGAVTIISSGAFASCDQLEAIALGSGIKEIHSYVFSGCSALKTLLIPEGVQYLPNISSCTSLTDLYLPDSIVYLSYYTLSNCSSLTKIHYSGTVEKWNEVNKDSSWYYGCPIQEVVCSNGTIYMI